MNVVSNVYKQQATKSTYHVLNKKSVMWLNKMRQCEIWRSLLVTAAAAPSWRPWRVQIAAARGRANWSWTQNSYFLAKMLRAIDIQLSLPSQCSKIDPVFSIEVIAWRPALYFIINQAPRPQRSGMQLQSAVQRNGKMRSWIFHHYPLRLFLLEHEYLS